MPADFDDITASRWARGSQRRQSCRWHPTGCGRRQSCRSGTRRSQATGSKLQSDPGRCAGPPHLVFVVRTNRVLPTYALPILAQLPRAETADQRPTPDWRPFRAATRRRRWPM